MAYIFPISHNKAADVIHTSESIGLGDQLQTEKFHPRGRSANLQQTLRLINP